VVIGKLATDKETDVETGEATGDGTGDAMGFHSAPISHSEVDERTGDEC
jgi:hypothetical protein